MDFGIKCISERCEFFDKKIEGCNVPVEDRWFACPLRKSDPERFYAKEPFRTEEYLICLHQEGNNEKYYFQHTDGSKFRFSAARTAAKKYTSKREAEREIALCHRLTGGNHIWEAVRA